MDNNLVAELTKETDRIWFNSRLLISDEAKSGLKEAVEYNKNILLNNSLINLQDTDVEKYLLKLAEHSFNVEKQIYKKGGEMFLAKIEEAFNNAKTNKKANLFLKDGKGVKNNLGIELSNLFYTGDILEMDTGLKELLLKLAKLDVQQLASDTITSNEQIVANAIGNVINNFFIAARDEKKNAKSVAKNDEDILNIFLTIYNEKNILDVLSGKTLSKSDLSKIIKSKFKEIQSSDVFKRIKDRAERNQILQQEEKDISENIDIILKLLGDSLIDDMYLAMKDYLNPESKALQNEIKEELRQLIIKGRDTKALDTEKAFSFRSAGSNVTFSMAAYRINTNKIGKEIGHYLIKNEQNYEEQFNINNYLNKISKSEQEELDDILINALNIYHNALRKYLGINSLAWQYYEQHFLTSTLQLASRDLKNSKTSEVLSNIHGELNRVTNFLPILNSYNIIIEKINKMKSNGLIDINTAKTLIDECSSKFKKTDAKDKEIFESITKALDSGNIEKGIDILLERLKVKRAGFSNLNGYVGEIFLTSVLKSVYNDKEILELEQRGASFNLANQDAHADIRFNDVGFQAKMLRSNNNALYQTEVDFSLDSALRYLRTNRTTLDSANAQYGDELTAFRYFLLNNTILSEIGITNEWNSDNLFLTALNLRINNFFRYTDGLAAQDLQNIANNFYIINMNIVPASLIFLKMCELISTVSDTKDKQRFLFEFKRENILPDYQGNTTDDYKLTKNKNLLKNIKTKATFKSFSMNLSDLGVETFLSRE